MHARSQDLGFRTSIFGSQDLDFRTSTRVFRTWISGPGFQFQDLDLRTWVSGPRREVSGPGSQDLGFRTSKALHPTVVLSFSRHFSLRPVVTDRRTVPYSLPCSLERKTLTLTGSAGYLKISKIKKSPQFGWVEKLQRTAGFQTVRGGYLVFFQNPLENHRDINLDTHRHRQTDRSQTD